MKSAVFCGMREALRGKKAVSRQEIWEKVADKCQNNMGLMDSIICKIMNDGRIATAQDDNHFFIVD
jgi:hypothetical protein